LLARGFCFPARGRDRALHPLCELDRLPSTAEPGPIPGALIVAAARSRLRGERPQPSFRQRPPRLTGAQGSQPASAPAGINAGARWGYRAEPCARRPDTPKYAHAGAAGGTGERTIRAVFARLALTLPHVFLPRPEARPRFRPPLQWVGRRDRVTAARNERALTLSPTYFLSARFRGDTGSQMRTLESSVAETGYGATASPPARFSLSRAVGTGYAHPICPL
jgi:hypothetical protein